MEPSDFPADIARLLARLRDGLVARGGVTLSAAQRVRRARLARQVMRHGVSQLSNQ